MSEAVVSDPHAGVATAAPPAPGITPPSKLDRQGVFLTDVIVELGFADERTVQEAVDASRQIAKTPERFLLDNGAIDERQLSLALAERNSLDHVDLALFEVDPEASGLIDKSTAARYTALPIAFGADGALIVAFEDPYDTLGINDIEVMAKSEVRPVVATGTQIRGLIEGLPESMPVAPAESHDDAAAPESSPEPDPAPQYAAQPAAAPEAEVAEKEAEPAQEAEPVQESVPVEEAQSVEEPAPIEQPEPVEEPEPLEEAEQVAEPGAVQEAEAVQVSEPVEEAEFVEQPEFVEEAATVLAESEPTSEPPPALIPEPPQAPVFGPAPVPPLAKDDPGELSATLVALHDRTRRAITLAEATERRIEELENVDARAQEAAAALAEERTQFEQERQQSSQREQDLRHELDAALDKVDALEQSLAEFRTAADLVRTATDQLAALSSIADGSPGPTQSQTE